MRAITRTMTIITIAIEIRIVRTEIECAGFLSKNWMKWSCKTFSPNRDQIKAVRICVDFFPIVERTAILAAERMKHPYHETVWNSLDCYRVDDGVGMVAAIFTHICNLHYIARKLFFLQSFILCLSILFYLIILSGLDGVVVIFLLLSCTRIFSCVNVI